MIQDSMRDPADAEEAGEATGTLCLGDIEDWALGFKQQNNKLFLIGQAPASLRAFNDTITYSAAQKQLIEEKDNAKLDMLG